MTCEQRQELKPGDLKRACGVHPRTMAGVKSPGSCSQPPPRAL